MLLNDRQIADRAQAGMLDPFIAHQVREVDGVPVVSYGLSSFGYDFRVGNTFKVFKPTFMPVVDPKAWSEKTFDEVEVPDHEAVIIPPNSFALGVSVERFDIPRDILCVVLGKSTYARCGLILNVTPLEPEWKGYVTLEISNTTPLPARVYAGEGIGQVLFHQGDPCWVSYADKKGKYQNQVGVVGPKV